MGLLLAHYARPHTEILTVPNALQLGNLSITWNPAAGSPTVHAIKIYRGNETIDVLAGAAFEILRREDQLEAARLDGLLTAVLRIADLRVGDELEVSITVHANDPTLGNNDAGILFIAATPAAGRYHIGLSWEKDRKPTVKITPELATVAQTSDGAMDVRLDNPPLLTPPANTPPRYQWQRIVEYSSFRDWAAISRHFAPLFAKAARLSGGSSLKTEVARIVAANTSPIDRVAAALHLVQQDVRYVYVGLNGSNLTPATADETWVRRYGDCKGKTALLLALLAEMGIEAEPVLVNNSGGDDGMDERLPSPRMFDHVLVRVKINGAIYWLDGTLPPVVPPSVSPAFPYRWVLPLTAQGDSIQALAWHPFPVPQEITLTEIDARAGFEAPAKVTSTTIMRGIKGLQQQVQLAGIAADQLTNGLRQQMVGGTWQTIDDVKWRYDQKAQASILTVAGTWMVDWDDDGDGAKSLSLVGGGFSPPERRTRAGDKSLPYYNEPDFNCYATTVRLPTSTKVANWTTNEGFDTHIFGRNYYRAFEIREGAVRMIRGSRIEQQEIDAASAEKDNDRIAKFDNSRAWIYYNPVSKTVVSEHETIVPATYDIDWTSDQVPCLAPGTRR
ncbi:DUF3857 domain-containing protein [Sphingobium phenoxybenzoativorans]|uniref:DUF3857 domain-containing protein n=1 Tax=Sphingobium phenoxybenzoativorans TaxID=1592790 RepID=UPI001FE854D7|nr:DUF3857 domain-containing protein [Sphingobium phenoxybenzoativorans]